MSNWGFWCETKWGWLQEVVLTCSSGSGGQDTNIWSGVLGGLVQTMRNTIIQTDSVSSEYTNIQTYQHTNIQTYQHTNIQTFFWRQIYSVSSEHTNIQTYQHKNIPTYQHTNIQTYKNTNIQTKPVAQWSKCLQSDPRVSGSSPWKFRCQNHRTA